MRLHHEQLKILQEKEQVEIVRDLFDIPDLLLIQTKEIPENQFTFFGISKKKLIMDV